MQELQIQFDFKARYYKTGKINRKTRQVWFVIHGYGQLAQYFIKKFEPLLEENICVIAPEGLSRFYLEDIPTRVAGGSNRVGATWMTKENREMDIENYINYLQSIYDFELGKTHSYSVTLLGFSQGAATTTRWALTGNLKFDRFVLWAGIFPPDMNFEVGAEIMKGKEIITVYGAQDPFINPDRTQEMDLLCDKIKVKPQQIIFQGKHEIDKTTLIQLSRL